MRIKQFDGFWQVSLIARRFPVSVYLVEGEDGLTLIDTGLGLAAAGVFHQAQKLGPPINRIVLTHAHLDHTGGLDKMKAARPQVEVICSEREAAILAGDRTARPGEQSTDNSQIPGLFPTLLTQPDVLVSDGGAAGPLTAIATPGHTPGHMCYLHEPSGALFAGDAFQTRGGLAVAGDRRWAFPFVAMGTWDKAKAVTSARQVAELPLRYLAPAHGEVLADPGELLPAAIDRAEQALTATD